MKSIFLFILCLGSISLLSGQDTTYDSLFFTGATGLRLPYRALQPMEQNSNEKFPLVIFLHGAGERGNDNKSQLIHGSSLFSNAHNRSTYPAFVIFPQCRQNSYWVTRDQAFYEKHKVFRLNYDGNMTEDLATVVELIEHYIRNYPVDKKRIYIAGLSMGGMGTFEMIQRFPNKFAAAVPICLSLIHI